MVVSNSKSSQTAGSEGWNQETDCRTSNGGEKSLDGGNCIFNPGTSHNQDEVDAEEPQVGMVFESEESAYEFYDEYARRVGFNVRKSKVQRRNDGTMIKRFFVCSKEGSKDRHPRTGLGKSMGKERASMRTDCMAHLVLKYTKDDGWVVAEYVREHNHPLSSRLALSSSEANASANVDDVGKRPADGFNYTKGATPQVGMVFKSDESAYEFYRAYARRVGFTVRKGKISRQRNGVTCGRLVTCSSEGLRLRDPRTLGKRRGRPQTRTNCKACIVLKVKNNDEWPWVVADIVYGHNHPLGGRLDDKIKTGGTVQSNEAGVAEKTKETLVEPIHAIESVIGGVVQDDDLALLEGNYNKNCLPTRRTKYLKKGEIHFLLEYLKRMKLANPSFFYSIQVDKDDQMTNFFWVDARQVIDYNHFGDVVCFDTTYRTNVYNLPVTPFVGVNHHKQFVLFGVALLLDETTNSFVWLFETWLRAMHGREPKTILIDQWDKVEKAVSMVMPGTRQCSCLWHMLQNSTKYLSHIYDKNPDFGNEFKNCIYRDDTEENFHSEWDKMLENYHLRDNKWLQDLYEVHNKWALINGRDIFNAGMLTVQHSESIKAFFTRLFKRNVSLADFLSGYEKVLISIFEEEFQEDTNDKQMEQQLSSEMLILKHAAKEYTRKVFGMFQEEFENSMCCHAEVYDVDLSVHKYKAFQFGQCKEFLVNFDAYDNTIVCSCMKFESEGVLCSHALKVLNLRDIFELPRHYILKRWTRNAKSEGVRKYHANEWKATFEVPMSFRFAELCHKAFSIAAKAALSKKALMVARNKLDIVLEEVEAVWKSEIAEKPQIITPYYSQENEVDGGDHANNNELNLSDNLMTSLRTLAELKNKHSASGAHSPHHGEPYEETELNDRASAGRMSSEPPVEAEIPQEEVASGSLPLPWTPMEISAHDIHSFDCNSMPFVLGQSSQGTYATGYGHSSIPNASQASGAHNLTSSGKSSSFGFGGGTSYQHPPAAATPSEFRFSSHDPTNFHL